MAQENKITILSTFAKDKLLSEGGALIREQKGGPALYLKQALDNEGGDFVLKTGSEVEVQILITKKGEFGKIPRRPNPKQVAFSKVKTPFLIISTLLDEYDLTNLPAFKGRVFLDVQGYVRNGNDFGKKKLWEPNREIFANIFCLKGTREELQKLPPQYIQQQKQKLLIITDGKRGCEVFASGKRFVIRPSKVVKSKNTIGAGDTFFAYFVSRFAKTGDVFDSARYSVERTMLFLSLQKRLKTNNARRKQGILFLAATHGDEGFSVSILRKLQKEFPQQLCWLIANKMAFERGLRFVDADLNRSAPGDPTSTRYEMRRASKLLDLAKQYRFVIDLHGTVARSGIFVLVPNPTPSNIALAASLPISNVVIWAAKVSEKLGPITQYVPCGVEIECGPKASPNVQKQLQKVLRAILTGGLSLNPAQKQNWFKVYGKLPKERIGVEGLRDFKQAVVDKETFYPLLVGQYEDAICYKMEKINFFNEFSY